MTTRIAVLASGGGSNLQALLEHHDALGDRRAGTVALVASNRHAAGALERARARGIPAVVLEDPADGEALGALLERHGIELVVLAGYLRLVPAAVTRRWVDRILNVHPALLPAFGGAGMYGRRVHEAVLASGARVSGPTVHLVDDAYDRGRILAQWPVPVLPDDTPDTLAARVLRVEHLLLPRVVELAAAGHLPPGPSARSAPPTASAGERAPIAGAVPDVAFTLTPDAAPEPALLDGFLAGVLPSARGPA